jgi:branched-chain amino acid transport system ATP-binding protein
MKAMLRVENVTKKFGGLKAVDNVSLAVDEGEIIGLIGPNGSGKTTLFNVISGYYKPTAGQVFLQDQEISGRPAHVVAAAGLSRTFQLVKPFMHLSVFDNVLIGALLRVSDRRLATSTVNGILDLLGLTRFSDELPDKLPIALKKKLEIARALATEPKILLLDEVMGGCNTCETDQLTETVQNLNRKGITIVIIEHKMRCIMSLAQRILVLDGGKQIAEGSPEEISRNPEVIRAYLGDGYHACDN